MEQGRDRRMHDLTTGSVWRKLLRFAIPFLIANILQTLYSVADMVIVGMFVKSEGISAVNTGSEFTLLCTSLVIGLSIGGTVMIAQYTGAKRHAEVERTIGTMLTLYAILAVSITVLGEIFAPQLLKMVNTPAEAYEGALSYLRITVGGLPFIFYYNAVGAILRGMGDSKSPMVFVAVATVTNIALDLLMVGPMNMGPAGAALATIIAQGVSVALAVITLMRRGFIFEFKLKSFRIDKAMLKNLIRVGLPSSIQMSISGVCFLAVTSLANSFGLIYSAAYGIVRKLDSFAVLPAIAMNSSMSSMIGQNIGAGRTDRVRKTLLSGMGITVAISAVVVVFMQVFAPQIVSWFDSTPDVIEQGAMAIRTMSWCYVALASMFCFNSLSNGSGHTIITLINVVASNLVVRVPAVYIFTQSLHMGFRGIFIGMAVPPVLGTLLGLLFYLSGKWQKSRLLRPEEMEAQSTV